MADNNRNPQQQQNNPQRQAPGQQQQQQGDKRQTEQGRDPGGQARPDDLNREDLERRGER